MLPQFRGDSESAFLWLEKCMMIEAGVRYDQLPVIEQHMNIEMAKNESISNDTAASNVVVDVPLRLAEDSLTLPEIIALERESDFAQLCISANGGPNIDLNKRVDEAAVMDNQGPLEWPPPHPLVLDITPGTNVFAEMEAEVMKCFVCSDELLSFVDKLFVRRGPFCSTHCSVCRNCFMHYIRQHVALNRQFNQPFSIYCLSCFQPDFKELKHAYMNTEGTRIVADFKKWATNEVMPFLAEAEKDAKKVVSDFIAILK